MTTATRTPLAYSYDDVMALPDDWWTLGIIGGALERAAEEARTVGDLARWGWLRSQSYAFRDAANDLAGIGPDDLED